MNLLVLSAHPDDETLGCGGTLLKHRAAGDHLFWFVATGPDPDGCPHDLVERKAAEVQRVGDAYGMERILRPGFPAAQLDRVALNDLIASIRKAIDEIRPQLVYVVHGGDAHSDHRITFTAALAVLKPFYMARWGVGRIVSYEALSSTEAAPPEVFRPFVPNIYSDITPYVDRKCEIMSLYESELHPYPLPREATAIRALARYRGATVGVEFAEAFHLIREVG